jgi:hypothetical protein
MQTEVQTGPRVKVQNTGRTRFKPGQNYYTIKRDRIAAKLDELTAEYFPAGGMTVMDNNRLKLAAGITLMLKHAVIPSYGNGRRGARNIC